MGAGGARPVVSGRPLPGGLMEELELLVSGGATIRQS